MSAPVWTVNGSAVARTTSGGAVWTVLGYGGGSAVMDDPGHKRVQLLDADVDQGARHLAPGREWWLSIKADVSGMSGSDIPAKIQDAWAELTTAFDPLLGAIKVQSARTDVSAAAVTRYLIADIVDVPPYQEFNSEPRGMKESGGYQGAGGYIVYVVRFRTLFPYFVGSALLTADHSAAAATLDIGASPDTVVIDNNGRRWTGIRIVFGSVSGSVTTVTIGNSANSDSLVISNAGGFANGDYLDFLATDPRVIDRSGSAVRFGGGNYRMRLEPGSQTLTGTRTAGTGTCTLTLSWPELHLTL